MKNKRLAAPISLLLSGLMLLLSAPTAGADSLFSLTATATPQITEKPVPTQTPAQTERGEGLFVLLATAAPSGDAASGPGPTALPTSKPFDTLDTSGVFRGLGYGDYSGKEAACVSGNAENGTKEFVYEQVTKANYKGYGIYLNLRGCRAEQTEADAENAVACTVYSQENAFSFQVVYQPDRQLLTLIIDPAEAVEGTDGPAAADPAETPSATRRANVCPHCNKGYCKKCHGSGFFKCSACGGLGACPTCHGKRQYRIPGYGGVGTATYVTCSHCGGNGKCTECGGRGRIDCSECDNGVCLYCHGVYVLDP